MVSNNNDTHTHTRTWETEIGREVKKKSEPIHGISKYSCLKSLANVFSPKRHFFWWRVFFSPFYGFLRCCLRYIFSPHIFFPNFIRIRSFLVCIHTRSTRTFLFVIGVLLLQKLTRKMMLLSISIRERAWFAASASLNAELLPARSFYSTHAHATLTDTQASTR